MTKRNIFIIIGVVLLLILSAIAFVYINQSSSNNNEAQTKEEAAESSKSSKKASFSTIAQGKDPQECTFKYTGKSGEGSGKMYNDGNGSARMEMNLTTSKGNTGTSNQIIKDEKVYSWFDTGSHTIGMVMDVKQIEEKQQTGESTTGPAPNESFSVNCKDWTVDDTKFEVPASVNFIDPQSMTGATQ